MCSSSHFPHFRTERGLADLDASGIMADSPAPPVKLSLPPKVNRHMLRGDWCMPWRKNKRSDSLPNLYRWESLPKSNSFHSEDSASLRMVASPPVLAPNKVLRRGIPRKDQPVSTLNAAWPSSRDHLRSRSVELVASWRISGNMSNQQADWRVDHHLEADPLILNHPGAGPLESLCADI